MRPVPFDHDKLVHRQKREVRRYCRHPTARAWSPAATGTSTTTGRQVRNLIACAQVRTKLPDASGSVLPEGGWSQRELLEFGRLAPKSEEHEQRYDFDRLDRRDVALEGAQRKN
jgi:hypothetical protein